MLLARRPDQTPTATDRVGRQCRDTHRHDRTLGGGQRPDRRQELVRAATVDDAEHSVAALGQSKRSLAPVLRFLVTLDETPPDEPVDQSAGGRWRPADRFGQLPDRQRVAVGEDVQGRQLGETEVELAELAGKTDDELSPEGPAHRDTFADLANVREPVAGCQDRCREVGLEATGDGTRRRRPSRWAVRVAFVGHHDSVRQGLRCVQPCIVAVLTRRK